MSQANPARFEVEPPRRGWFGRNWLWFVPTVLILPILLCGGCFGGLFYIGVQAIKGHPMYVQAVERVQNSDAVQEKLGEPIEVSTVLPDGEFKMDGSSSVAKFLFSVKGPKGSANVIAEGQMVDGAWHFDKFTVTPDADGAVIDLADEPVVLENDAPAFGDAAEEQPAGEAKPIGPPPALNIEVEQDEEEAE